MSQLNRQPLRVLMLIHRMADNSPYCFFVHEQAKALRALGHDVTVIAPVGALPGYRFLRPAAGAIMRDTPKAAVVDGVPVHYPRYPALGDAGLKLLGGAPMFRAALPVARALHRECPFDILHAHMLPAEGHAGLLLGKALGIPSALTVHGTDVLRYFREGETPWPRNAATAARTPLLMAVSGMLAAKVTPYRQRPVEVVLNGVDLTDVPARNQRRPRHILTGSTLKARKCIHTTLDAFSALAEAYPDATLSVIGEGPDRAALEEKIAARGLQARVTLTGAIPHTEVLRLMSTGDAFVMPSYAEGFGIVYIEAMAAGCVSVGSVGEGIADLIRDGENGFLVPAADVDALIPVLCRLLEGGGDIEAVRAMGTRDARGLTWERNAIRCAELYRQTISSR